jgi:hypothetical protein
VILSSISMCSSSVDEGDTDTAQGMWVNGRYVRD